MRVVSVNVTEPTTVTVKGRELRTSIFKRPVATRVSIDRLGFVGEQRISERMCDAEDHALYMYPREHYGAWERELGVTRFPHGQFGENLTVEGLLEDEARIGDVLRCGSATLEVRQPRLPCKKLDARMGRRFAGRFLRSRRLGFFLRVLEPGAVAAGDGIEVLARDPREPTVDELIRISQIDYWDAVGLEGLLESDKLPEPWRESLRGKLERARGAEGWHGLRELEVVARQRECADATSLWLGCARGRPLAGFEPGQYLTLAWRDERDQVVRRAYAITSAPDDLRHYRITVRRLAHGARVSAALHDDVGVGTRLRAAAPRGRFTLGAAAADARGVSFVSDAAGAASVVPLVLHWSRRPRAVHAWHIEAAPDSQLPLRDELAAIHASETLTHRTLEPADSAPRGRPVDRDAWLDAELGAIAGRVSDAFVAGESGFVDRVERLLAGSGVAVHCERFGRSAS